MKLLNKWSLALKGLAVSALITLICVFAGGFITKKLVERERENNIKFRPSVFHYRVIKELVDRKNIPVKEAFAIVQKNQEQSTPFHAYLLDAENKILDYYPDDADLEIDFSKEQKFPLKGNLFLVFPKPNFGGPRSEGPPRPEGPPPGEFHGRPPHDGPPPGPEFGRRHHNRGPGPRHDLGMGIIGAVAIAVSILVGLGLSIIFLTIYVRKKSAQAEQVIAKLKSGDLKARFKIGQTDESAELMLKFNDMADQIEMLVENLRATEKARMVLLQELAHDLRTPVASLKNLQEMLLDKGHLMDEEKRKHVQTLAIKEVQYFERLVEDLLFLSGVNDPRYSGNFKSVNMNDLIQEEVELFESQKLQIEFQKNVKGTLSGDEHLLRRLIKNALSNASRFARSKITVKLQNEHDELVLHVLDDGPGMNPEDLGSFGQKKYSRHLRENDKISIGLGSVIMKKIMSLHDGDLVVKNREEGGLDLIMNFKNCST